jgi:hypothetical protein
MVSRDFGIVPQSLKMKWDDPLISWDMPNVTFDNPADSPDNTPKIMANSNPQTDRIDPKVLQSDIVSYQALQTITGYTPANVAYAKATGETTFTTMTATQASETQKKAAADAARDDATAAEWNFHNFILGMKDQVKAQYGADSNELQSVGLKKKSEKKKPSSKKTPPPATK